MTQNSPFAHLSPAQQALVLDRMDSNNIPFDAAHRLTAAQVTDLLLDSDD